MYNEFFTHKEIWYYTTIHNNYSPFSHCSTPPSLSLSLPLSLCPSLPLSLSSSVPLFRSPSLPLSLRTSLNPNLSFKDNDLSKRLRHSATQHPTLSVGELGRVPVLRLHPPLHRPLQRTHRHQRSKLYRREGGVRSRGERRRKYLHLGEGDWEHCAGVTRRRFHRELCTVAPDGASTSYEWDSKHSATVGTKTSGTSGITRTYNPFVRLGHLPCPNCFVLICGIGDLNSAS